MTVLLHIVPISQLDYTPSSYFPYLRRAKGSAFRATRDFFQAPSTSTLLLSLFRGAVRCREDRNSYRWHFFAMPSTRRSGSRRSSTLSTSNEKESLLLKQIASTEEWAGWCTVESEPVHQLHRVF